VARICRARVSGESDTESPDIFGSYSGGICGISGLLNVNVPVTTSIPADRVVMGMIVPVMVVVVVPVPVPVVPVVVVVVGVVGRAAGVVAVGAAGAVGAALGRRRARSRRGWWRRAGRACRPSRGSAWIRMRWGSIAAGMWRLPMCQARRASSAGGAVTSISGSGAAATAISAPVSVTKASPSSSETVSGRSTKSSAPVSVVSRRRRRNRPS
jgi:hypothetical protein